MHKISISLVATLFFGICLRLSAQPANHLFKIRTITAGITVTDLSDTTSLIKAVEFLKQARTDYTNAGYEVQTIRISTQNLHEYLGGKTLDEALPYLKKFDEIALRDDVSFAIGAVLPLNEYNTEVAGWAAKLIGQTELINFSLPVSSTALGIHRNTIKAAAEIVVAVAKVGKGGEGNFRFTASANCPAGIPFFPAAFHSGVNSFAVGIEYPNLLTDVFSKSTMVNARQNLKAELEKQFLPVQALATRISSTYSWQYDGIDTSPAPGLDASIGTAIETLTKQPFGGPSTLSACSLITDVIKNLDLKTCGYSGLMLPVIEDKVLAQRANENRYTVQELLLFSSVSGTGLDVVPLAGSTSAAMVERIFTDVASLSLKYTNKALSARLFLIPGKKVGDKVTFDNPYLTAAKVMRVE
ncbi:DUF711 family protein [uncultured Imperialibacter sp.]|uniref:DUF711 family protein n=1 Tax=uncultured Imperialibacter sp. TaxID=1672639 RepID=UPI0030DBEB26|tara:strand:- start:170318 stop:171556 length:1239 start_codon:yes stop_codon:yes gene_type:complete